MIWTAQLPRGAEPERVALIEDRWRWRAFLAPLLWSLFGGRWILSAATLLLSAGLVDLALSGRLEVAAIAALGARLIFGWEGGALARLDLRLRRWRLLGMVEAASEAEAETRWFIDGGRA